MAYDKFLSQDEVDELLKGVSGEADAPKASDAAPLEEGGVRPYNLATQERIIRGNSAFPHTKSDEASEEDAEDCEAEKKRCRYLCSISLCQTGVFNGIPTMKEVLWILPALFSVLILED